MGRCIFVYGKSGAGKSRSLKFFNEDEIFLVQVEDKDLPFRKKFKYSAVLSDPAVIMSQLEKMPCKIAVIDDAGYIMTKMFMRGHGKGDQFKLYNNIADTMYSFIQDIKQLPKDVNVYMIFHEDQRDDGFAKISTIGKLLDDKVRLEGLVTVCLRAIVKGKEHLFLTNSEGYDIVKSPEEMFKDVEIENNLKAVDEAIREYYGE